MSNPMEKAAAYLSKLEADRMAAMELSKEKELEAMLIKAMEEGFREAAPISMKPGAPSRWTSSAESGLRIDLVPTSAPTQAQSLMIRSDRDSGSRGRNSCQSSSWSCSRTTIGPSRPPSVASFPPVRQP
jgi:hypothetical protein